jgi:Uma2 family endonuclease
VIDDWDVCAEKGNQIGCLSSGPIVFDRWVFCLNERNARKSREEYFALLENDPEHRYEYLDGYIYMMTGGSPDHAIIGNNIGRMLGNLLQGRRCIVYNSDLYVELSDNYRVCPDVTVSCDPRDRGSKDAIRYPCLVVEVLSPATEARDRGKKSLQYRSCPTIQEYLLVNTDPPIIEIFRREKNGFWTLYTVGKDDTVELSNLGVHLPVAEVYQNTSLEEA